MATLISSKPDILTSTMLGRSILAQMNELIYKLTSGAILASYAEPEKGWKVSRLLDWISLPIRLFVASILFSVYGFILLIESTMCCANRGFKTLFVTARKKLYNRLLFCVYSPRDNAAKNIYEVGHCIYKYNAYGARVRFVKMPELEAITDDAKSLLAISCLQGVLAGNMQPCCAKGADLKGEALEANLIALGDYLINNTHDIYYAGKD